MFSESGLPADPWLDRFFELFFRINPVDASFAGVEGFDHAWPDFSAAGIRAAREEWSALLDALVKAPASGSAWVGVDRRLAAGAARLAHAEGGRAHVVNNPSRIAGEAVFGLMAPLLVRARPEEERTEAVRARLAGLPRFLDEALAGLDSAPEPWTRRAVRECRGGLEFLRTGLDSVDTDFQPERALAISAFEEFERVLRRDHLPRSRPAVGCGPDFLDQVLRDGHLLSRSAQEISDYARQELEHCERWLAESAADYGLAEPADVEDALARVGPTAETYYSRFPEVWDEQRSLGVARNLVTWPDAPVAFVPRPLWSRGAAPDLYFLFYRSPPAVNGPAVHQVLVPPVEDLSETERADHLRAFNDSVIRLNYVVHHAGLGHHVQNWHARRSPSRVGRIAAVDGASKISLICGGTMAEGWSCYATALVAEAGGLTSFETYAEHRARVRMCVRAIVDVEFHSGRMTLEEAAALYRHRCSMSREAAWSEAVKNSMFPGAALIYLIGSDAIRQLRTDLMNMLGDRFDLRAFHDGFLSYGSVPVALITEEMTRRARAGLPLDAHAPEAEA
jgi:hypothetical protein